MPNPRSAFTTIEVVVVVALLGALGLMVAKPKFLSGESRRADQSRQATQQVVQAQAKVEDAQAKIDETAKQRSSTAAASVTTMVKAAEEAPKSPHSAFIAKEGRLALTYLDPADPAALLASEQRYSAFLEGKVELIQTLYSDAYKESKELATKLEAEKKAKAEAEAKLADAMAQRAAIDQKLIVKAAEHLATERQRNMAILVAVVIGGLWLWAKLTHFSPFQMKNAVLDIQNGVQPIVALDTNATPLQQRIVNLLTRILK